jgi:hypothetical protein
MSRIDIAEMRVAVSNMYSGEGWKKKVSAMPNGQVFAIFNREQHKREEAEAKARAEKRRAARTGLPPVPSDELPF